MILWPRNAAKPKDTAGLFVIMAIIGAASIALLPVALELACELTRNADGSSAVLWFLCVATDRIVPASPIS